MNYCHQCGKAMIETTIGPICPSNNDDNHIRRQRVSPDDIDRPFFELIVAKAIARGAAVRRERDAKIAELINQLAQEVGEYVMTERYNLGLLLRTTEKTKETLYALARAIREQGNVCEPTEKHKEQAASMLVDNYNISGTIERIALALATAEARGRAEQREKDAKIAELTAEGFVDRRDDQLRDHSPTAALVHARQAQTATDIARTISEQGNE